MGSPRIRDFGGGWHRRRHDADGDKIAMVQRQHYPGEMALPKGKIEEGGAIPAAAQRETSEETGCEVTDPDLLARCITSLVTCRKSYSSI